MVKLQVNNVNEPPSVKTLRARVTEGDPIDSRVGMLHATDPDTDTDTADLDYIPFSTLNAFKVDTDGTIRVANSSVLNYETHPYVTFQVLVTDGHVGTLASSLITVEDYNDLPKLLKPHWREIDEHALANSNVGSPLVAHDEDLDQDVYFSIAKGNECYDKKWEMTVEEVFRINFCTGQLRLVHPDVRCELTGQWRLALSSFLSDSLTCGVYRVWTLKSFRAVDCSTSPSCSRTPGPATRIQLPSVRLVVERGAYTWVFA